MDTLERSVRRASNGSWRKVITSAESNEQGVTWNQWSQRSQDGGGGGDLTPSYVTTAGYLKIAV